MATITSTTSQKSTKKPSTTSVKAAPKTTATSPKTSNGASDRATISKEASEKSGSAGGTVALLNGLKENYGTSSSETKKVDEVKAADQAKPLSNEEKIDKVKSQLDSLKGLKGEELQNKLKELEKTDPELAEYLKKILDKDEKKDAEEAKKDEAKPAEAKAAEKSKGADDGAPSEQFLWKPASESNGKLVILLPASMNASSVSISGPNVNESGSGSGRANGQRQHFRFGKAGKDMQGPVSVNIQLQSGGTKTITVANPAERKEGGDMRDAGQARQGMPGFGAFAGL